MFRIIVLAVVLIALVSCSEERWKSTVAQGSQSEGRKLFIEMECYEYHEVKGEKFPVVAGEQRGIGPELSRMAGMHPAEFFAESKY